MESGDNCNNSLEMGKNYYHGNGVEKDYRSKIAKT